MDTESVETRRRVSATEETREYQSVNDNHHTMITSQTTTTGTLPQISKSKPSAEVDARQSRSLDSLTYQAK